MSDQRRTEQSISTAIESLESVLNNQTDTTLSSIRRLEQQNKDATQRYVTMNEAAEGLAADEVFLRENNSEIARYVEQVDDVAREVQRIERLVEQMNEWSKELAVKVKRL